MAGPASYSSYQNRGKNAGSLDIATLQSVPMKVLPQGAEGAATVSACEVLPQVNVARPHLS